MEYVPSRPRQFRKREALPALSPSVQWLDVDTPEVHPRRQGCGQPEGPERPCVPELSPHGDTHIEQMLAQLAPYLSAQMSPPQKGLSQAP